MFLEVMLVVDYERERLALQCKKTYLWRKNCFIIANETTEMETKKKSARKNLYYYWKTRMLLFNFFLQCDASFFSPPKLSWNHLCALVERDCSCDNLMWNFRFFCVGAWSSSKTHKFVKHCRSVDVWRSHPPHLLRKKNSHKMSSQKKRRKVNYKARRETLTLRVVLKKKLWNSSENEGRVKCRVVSLHRFNLDLLLGL